MSDVLTTADANLLIDANEKNFLSYTREFASRHDHFLENNKLMFSISGIDGVSMINNAVSKSKLSEIEVADTLKLYKDAGKPVMWSVFPSTSPRNIAEVFKKKGFMHLERNTLMYMNMEFLNKNTILPDRLFIKTVDDIKSLKDWSTINMLCFGYTSSVQKFFVKTNEALLSDKYRPCIHFIAYLKGKPVGASSVFMADGVAGLYNIATLPEARGLGIGEAVTRAAMMAGKNAGYGYATLQATKKGKPLYKKIGFQSNQHMDFYLKLHGKSLIIIPATYLLRMARNFIKSLFTKL